MFIPEAFILLGFATIVFSFLFVLLICILCLAKNVIQNIQGEYQIMIKEILHISYIHKDVLFLLAVYFQQKITPILSHIPTCFPSFRIQIEIAISIYHCQ